MNDRPILRDLMTRDTAPTRSGLYLVFGEDSPTWREECEHCGDTGLEPEPGTGECLEPSAWHPEYPCRVCDGDGTGQRKFRLAGMVEVRERGWLGEKFGATYQTIPAFTDSDITMKVLKEKLVEGFKSHTLPPSLLHTSEGGTCEWGLRKVEVAE